ncbi:hypothetical protein ABZ477_18010 [Microbacterium sp. NPDC019599]|uniref:hypothetical protein n=1 Tax=Microbacterium sp. NPDC019599 TaxID=3154690 RepID=UPI0033E702B1
MFGRKHHPKEEEPAVPAKDAVEENADLAAWEEIEIQRRLQLEVQSFEGGIEG